MAEPNDYRAILELQHALRQLRTENGCHYDVDHDAVMFDAEADVESLIAPDAKRPFVMLEVGDEEWDYPERPGGVTIMIPVLIHWVHDASPRADRVTGDPTRMTDDRRAQIYWRGVADVERVINQHVQGGSQTMIDCRIMRRSPSRFDTGALVWAEIDTRIYIRRTYGEP